jgi:hypothetical protein
VDQRIAFVANDECGVVGAKCHPRGAQNLEVTIFIVEKSGARCSDHDKLPRKGSHVGVEERLEVSHVVSGGGRNGAVATNSFGLLVVRKTTEDGSNLLDGSKHVCKMVRYFLTWLSKICEPRSTNL